MLPTLSTDPTQLAAFWQALTERPYDFDLFYALRHLQAQHPESPRLGYARRPRDEPVRLGQDPSLAFAPATIAQVQPATAQRNTPRVTVWNFGLYGPNGPMPLHITEYVLERWRHHGDPTLVRFSDIFHHRFLLLFFRAWSDAQPSTSLDRPGADPFGRYLSSIVGVGSPSMRERDALPDHAKRHAAGHLTRNTRNPEGLCQMLRAYFEVPVHLHEYCLHYLELAPQQQTQLSQQPCNSALGLGAVVGERVLDAQSKFRLTMGPLSWSQYQRFLPDADGFAALIDTVRNYIGIEYAWDYELVLRAGETPSLQLGDSSRLGWSTWLKLDAAQASSTSWVEPEQASIENTQNFRLDAELWLHTRGLRYSPLKART